MDDYMKYYYKKSKGRINFLLFLCVIGTVVAMYFTVKNAELGKYEEENMPMIILGLCIGGIILGAAFYRGLLALATKSMGWTIFAIVLTFPAGLFFYLPMVGYHNGSVPLKYRGKVDPDDKVFKATVRAYQKAWNRQNFFKRVGIPLLVVAGLYFGYQAAIFCWENFNNETKIAQWILIGIIVLLTLYAIGGVQDVRRTYDTYEASVGQTWLDYGEVTWHKTNSVTKDETDVSFLGLIISFALLPFIVMLFVLAVVLYLLISFLQIIIPTGGKRLIYLHKRTIRFNPMYMPFADSFLSVVMAFVNKLLGLVFSVNFVNEDFWLDGVGAEYIERNISERNGRYLEKLLDKVENKYGYRYYFK